MKLLKEPIKIKNIQLRNRLVMPPMATAKSGEDGAVTTQLCDYYDEKSKGGYIGLIITEHSFISQEGKASPNQVSISKDSDIEGFRKIAEVIHANGSKVIAQINHAGSAADRKVTGCEVLSASPVRNSRFSKIPEDLPCEMDEKDIKKIIQEYKAEMVK